MGFLNKKNLLLSATLVMTLVGATAHANIFDSIFNRRRNPQPLPPPVVVQPAPQQGSANANQTNMTEDERIAAEEARLGRPLTQGEREIKVAMDKFVYQPKVNMPMYITRTTWTEQDEIEFGKFVAKIGQGVASKKCGTATACMRNPEINMYATMDPPTLELYTDCADLPYFLRAYFAYHNGLPFSYVTEVDVNPIAYTSTDDQQKNLESSTAANSPYGNRIVRRGGSNIAAGPGREKNFVGYVSNLINSTSTSTNRVGPMTPGVEQSDIFPVTLDRRGVRPGTIVAATGHAMIVWSVNDAGEIHIIDGHPGSFIQEHLLVSSKIKMSRPDQGVGYYQFRPLNLVGAQKDSRGYFYGGTIVPATNQQLIQAGRYSLEQFFGPRSTVQYGDQVDPTLWKRAYQKTSVFTYLTNNLRGQAITAEREVQNNVEQFCSDVKERVKNYANSLAAGVAGSAHPETLVQDVFGAADASWEKFSTPGGDSRLRESVKDIVMSAIESFKQAKAGARGITYAGSAQDYVKALRQVIAKANASCEIYYTNSAGKRVNLTLNEVSSRLNRLSFDPYMCPEKSWGAVGAELASCVDQDINNDWYNAEKYMRNVIGKIDENGTATLRSDREITLPMLLDTTLIDRPSAENVNLGSSKAPIMNLDATFASEAFLKRLTN